MLKKYFIRIFLGLLFSAVLAYLILKRIDFKKSLEFVKSTNALFLILGILIYAFTYILRTVRYYFIISPLKKTRVLENFPYTVLGFFINNIIPLRFGELVRAKVTGWRFRIPCSSVLATIVIERLFDITIFVLFLFTAMFFIYAAEFIKRPFYVLTSFFIVCLALLYVALINKTKVLKFVAKVPLGVSKKKIFDFFCKFADGLKMLKIRSALIKTFAMSAVIWTVEALSFVTIAAACNIDLSLWEAIFTIVAIGAGVVIPTAPGYVGAFEFIGIAALSIVSVDKNAALACTAVYHLSQLTVIFILGFTCIVKTKLSFSDLFKFVKIDEKQ